MMTIQDLLSNVYCCIKNILKKCYQKCAILVSSFSVFALISLNMHDFGHTGRYRLVEECSVFREPDNGEPEENAKKTEALGGGNFAVICKNAFNEKQGRIMQESKERAQKLEMTEVCASIEPVQNEVRIEPVNPYGEIDISNDDYEALCRIVQAEAGGEDVYGKTLVAEVVLNRVLSEDFESTVYGVVFERSGGSAQFSPTADGRYYTVDVTAEAVEAVEKALHGEDFSEGALFFSARSRANPNDMAWFDRNLKWLFQYGGHEFYTLPGDKI